PNRTSLSSVTFLFLSGTGPRFADSFPSASRLLPALCAPQAFRLSEALPTNCSRLLAALRSRSRTRPHRAQGKVRSERVRSASRHPQPLQRLLEGSHRSARSTLEPYQAAL